MREDRTRERQSSTATAAGRLTARADRETCYSFEGNAHDERGVMDAMSVDDHPRMRGVTAPAARATA
jgi:hypothetical protein